MIGPNNLIFYSDITTCTLFIPDPVEHNIRLNLYINNIIVDMHSHPKTLGLTLDPKLTNITLISRQPKHPIIKFLSSTKWCKHKEAMLLTYKTLARPIIEHSSTIYLLNLQQTLQNYKLYKTQLASHFTQTFNICMTKQT